MLARIRKAMEEREGGFTLIELLVVIIIIGILAAIAIPVFLNQRNKATESGMKSDLRAVANELESFFTDTQAYGDVTDPGANFVVESSNGTDTVNVKKSDPDTELAVFDNTLNSGQAYCIELENTRISKTWHYNSEAGGIATGTC